MRIPTPSLKLTSSFDPVFEPCTEMVDHVHETLLNPIHEMYNEDHEHLKEIDLAFLFTNVGNSSKGNDIIGMAQLDSSSGDPWSVERRNVQLLEWFGYIPEALITINGIWFSGASNLQRYALLEHEMYHIAQQTDEYGTPKYSKTTGKPLLKMRGHDVEEFVDVVHRYGTYSPQLIAMKIAMDSEPKFKIEQIDGICGSCKKRVA